MTPDTTLAWHFTDGPVLRVGNPLPPKGEWLVHPGPIVICESGLHASRRLLDALAYAPGSLCHRVEVRGIAEEEKDKLVARERRVIASVEALPVLLPWSRWCALRVAHLWDCPPVVRHFLETGDHAVEAAEAAWAARTAVLAARAARAAARETARSEAARAAWVAARAARATAREAADAARAAALAREEATRSSRAEWAAAEREAQAAEQKAQNAELESLMLEAMNLAKR